MLFAALMAALIVLPAGAQKRKGHTKKKAAPVANVVPEDPKFEEMLMATQRIIIIDSIVVDKKQFLQCYKLNAEAGNVSGYNDFFKSTEQPYSTVYINQMKNKCWFAKDGKLYTSDMLGDKWSEPAVLEGLGKYQRSNYPFVMSDGTTLYFAAISNEGLGGLDIYVSRYDSEAGNFLLAENLGLPFNSDANDYMYAVDEFTGIGYFATDRRQPEGKVCIYTFIPNQKRLTYSDEELDDEMIRSRARIDRIADTWGDGKARKEVLAKIAEAKATQNVSQDEPKFTFFINDDITYTSLDEFLDADNQERINELNGMQKRYHQMARNLDEARVNYMKTGTSNADKAQLYTELLDYEQKFYQLERNIKLLQKIIRNAEITALGK